MAESGRRQHSPPFCVAEFCREYPFEKEMKWVSVRVTADTFLLLDF